MKNSSVSRILMLTLVAGVALLFAGRSFAKAVDMYLEIKDAKGKVTKVPVKDDGTFTTPALKAGTYSFSWGASNPTTVGGSGMSSGRATAEDTWTPPSQVCVTHEIVAPRDLATGQASGKRMHKPVTFTKSIDAASPKFFTSALGDIVLDSDCDGITGTVSFIDAAGKKVPASSWDLATSKK